MAPFYLEKLEFWNVLVINILHGCKIFDDHIQVLLIGFLVHLSDVFGDKLFLEGEYF